MATSIHFTKMHAIGNDFAVIDAQQQPFKPTAALITQMANRRTGIGFDQLLLLNKSTHPDANFDYHVFNADGKECQHCGNGARCIGLYIKHQTHSTQPVTLQLHDRLITLFYEQDDIAVDMGNVQFSIKNTPYMTNSCDPHTLRINDQAITFYLADIGNPHAVIFTDSQETKHLHDLGNAFNQHSHFPNGINVSLAHILSPTHLQLTVYERGLNHMSQGCGTAACVVAAIGHQLNHLSSRVNVSQPGGDLTINIKDNLSIIMQGTANLVYHGQWMAV